MERLDIYVARLLPALSRSSAAKLIDRGKVSVNGQAQLKSGYKVRPADDVDIDYDEDGLAGADAVEIPVLYEDDDCVVINKPAGVLSHSKGAFNPENTVASWLESRWKGQPGERAGIVHRLDRATSGVMICAKTPDAAAWLQKQFGQRKVNKIYTAVVNGSLNPPQAIIDMPIERNPKKPQTFRAGVNGKPATTAYKVLSASDKLSLIELKPTTGRTHQLRVHLKQLGHPILGDTLYGGTPSERLYLHATSLEITLPNRQRKTFEVKTPKEFQEVMK